MVRVRWTDRHDGDFHVDAPAADLAARRRTVADGAWTWLRQVHGCEVVVVDRPGARAGAEADAAVTSTPGAVLAVHTADCAPLVVAGPGVVGVAHAGWRGLVAGVIPAMTAALRRRTDGELHALLGPCIGPDGYEFGADDLETVVAATGAMAASRTRAAAPALDLAAAVRAVCGAEGIASFSVAGPGPRPPDTAGARWFSHRTRADTGRQVTVAWLEERP